jgi:predicted HNH restriction endonuclease
MACRFNFEAEYGQHGKGFIHVHHIKPLNETGETLVDPKTDLIPLCPNCHAMVHKNKNHTLSLNELKALLK